MNARFWFIVEWLLVALGHIFKLEGKVQVHQCGALVYRENPQRQQNKQATPQETRIIQEYNYFITELGLRFQDP